MEWLLSLLGIGAEEAAAKGLLGAATDKIAASLPTTMAEAGDVALSQGKSMAGITPYEKSFSALTNPDLDFRQTLGIVGPEAYKLNEQANAQFKALQQPISTPTYATPYRPYQGGGIEEILARQQGLLR